MSEEEVLQYVDAIKEIVGEEENDSEGIMEEMSHVNGRKWTDKALSYNEIMELKSFLAEPREESMILKMNEFLDNQVKEGKIYLKSSLSLLI